MFNNGGKLSVEVDMRRRTFIGGVAAALVQARVSRWPVEAQAGAKSGVACDRCGPLRTSMTPKACSSSTTVSEPRKGALMDSSGFRNELVN